MFNENKKNKKPKHPINKNLNKVSEHIFRIPSKQFVNDDAFEVRFWKPTLHCQHEVQPMSCRFCGYLDPVPFGTISRERVKKKFELIEAAEEFRNDCVKIMAVGNYKTECCTRCFKGKPKRCQRCLKITYNMMQEIEIWEPSEEYECFTLIKKKGPSEEEIAYLDEGKMWSQSSGCN
tara:strand:- start:5549 stop:6079 length:531 start_codon:yes stop_codon:yes gene_type:complete